MKRGLVVIGVLLTLLGIIGLLITIAGTGCIIWDNRNSKKNKNI